MDLIDWLSQHPLFLSSPCRLLLSWSQWSRHGHAYVVVTMPEARSMSSSLYRSPLVAHSDCSSNLCVVSFRFDFVLLLILYSRNKKNDIKKKKGKKIRKKCTKRETEKGECKEGFSFFRGERGEGRSKKKFTDVMKGLLLTCGGRGNKSQENPHFLSHALLRKPGYSSTPLSPPPPLPAAVATAVGMYDISTSTTQKLRAKINWKSRRGGQGWLGSFSRYMYI